MRIMTDYSELMIMALDECQINYGFNDDEIYFVLPDSQDIPKEISDVMQLVSYSIQE